VHIFIVNGGDGAEPLLTSGVPDLDLHVVAPDIQILLAKLNSERSANVFVEFVVRKSVQQARLPHAFSLFSYRFRPESVF